MWAPATIRTDSSFCLTRVHTFRRWHTPHTICNAASRRKGISGYQELCIIVAEKCSKTIHFFIILFVVLMGDLEARGSFPGRGEEIPLLSHLLIYSHSLLISLSSNEPELWSNFHHQQPTDAHFLFYPPLFLFARLRGQFDLLPGWFFTITCLLWWSLWRYFISFVPLLAPLSAGGTPPPAVGTVEWAYVAGRRWRCWAACSLFAPWACWGSL